MDVMELRRGLLMAILAGGEDVLPDKEFIIKTTSETTLKAFLADNPIPLKYRDEICWLRFYNDNAPSSGGCSNWYAFFIQNLEKQGMLTCYSNTNKSPNSMALLETVSAQNSNYYDLTNNKITSTNSTNTSRYIPTGTEAYVLHIPFNWANFNMVSTEI